MPRKGEPPRLPHSKAPVPRRKRSGSLVVGKPEHTQKVAEDVRKDLQVAFPGDGAEHLARWGLLLAARRVLAASEEQHPDHNRLLSALTIGLPVGKLEEYGESQHRVGGWLGNFEADVVASAFLVLLSWQQRLQHKARKVLNTPRNAVSIRELRTILEEVAGLGGGKSPIYP